MEVEGRSLSCIYNIHTMYNTHASLSVEKLLATARSGTHIRTSLSVEKLLATACSGTHIRTSLSVEKLLATARSGTHIRTSLSVEKLLATARSGTHIRTSLSVEKLLATARSGTHTNIINYYIYIHIFLQASPIVEKLVALKCCTYTKLAVTVTTFANKPLQRSGHHTPQMGNINLTHTSGHSLVTMSMCAHTHTHTPHRMPVRLLTHNLHSQ